MLTGLALGVVALVPISSADAAELKVKAGFAMSEVLGELTPRFERASGQKVIIEYGLSGALKKEIETGEAFDIAIISPGMLDDLIKQGKIVSTTRGDIARVGIGVAVRTGAPKPDVGSIELFKRAMLSAKSIVYSPQGTSGLHMIKVFDRLGISEQMKAKAQLVDGNVLQPVSEGSAELGLLPANILLSSKGVELAGLLPIELQTYIEQTAGVGSATSDLAGSTAFVKFLQTPEATAVIKAKGMERFKP